MTEYLRQGLQLLTPQQRARMFILVGAMAVGALLEAMGVAIIVPFVFLLAEPTSVFEHARAKPIFDFIGIDTADQLIILSSGALLLFYIIRGGYLALLYFALFRFIFHERVQISNMLLSQYIDAPITFHLGRNSNELIKNTTDRPYALRRMLSNLFLGIGPCPYSAFGYCQKGSDAVSAGARVADVVETAPYI